MAMAALSEMSGLAKPACSWRKRSPLAATITELAGWTPTVDNYLGRVTKARILEAVREAKGEASAQLIDHLKKPDMAKEAERLLAGSGWLPEPLRMPDAEAAANEPATTEDLPAFLNDDEDASVDSDPEEPQPPAIAAE